MVPGAYSNASLLVLLPQGYLNCLLSALHGLKELSRFYLNLLLKHGDCMPNENKNSVVNKY